MDESQKGKTCRCSTRRCTASYLSEIIQRPQQKVLALFVPSCPFYLGIWLLSRSFPQTVVVDGKSGRCREKERTRVFMTKMIVVHELEWVNRWRFSSIESHIVKAKGSHEGRRDNCRPLP
jgi:hypothetical protein